jgi:hypothetical protein
MPNPSAVDITNNHPLAGAVCLGRTVEAVGDRYLPGRREFIEINTGDGIVGLAG